MDKHGTPYNLPLSTSTRIAGKRVITIMNRVYAESERVIKAIPKEVYSTLIDFHHKRPSILTPNFVDYTVEKGGIGEGTVVRYRLQAAGRERPYRMRIAEPIKGKLLIERDINSSLITTWTLTPLHGGQQTKVRLASEWEGSSGTGGFFERIFAPLGLRRIYARILSQLAQKVQSSQENYAVTGPLEERAAGVYLRTTTLGFVAGLRSMMPLAVLNWTSERAQSGTASPAQLLTTLAALGEAVADKLPAVPSRTSPGPLTGRLVIGGLAGMVLCKRAHIPPILGIVTGAMGAAAGAFAGNYSRTWLSQATKIPDLLWGGLEDILALGLGIFAAQKKS